MATSVAKWKNCMKQKLYKMTNVIYLFKKIKSMLPDIALGTQNNK